MRRLTGVLLLVALCVCVVGCRELPMDAESLVLLIYDAILRPVLVDVYVNDFEAAMAADGFFRNGQFRFTASEFDEFLQSAVRNAEMLLKEPKQVGTASVGAGRQEEAGSGLRKAFGGADQ